MSDLKVDLRAILNKSGTKLDTGALSKLITLAATPYDSGELVIGTSEVDFSTDVSTPGLMILQLNTAGATVDYGPKITGPAIEDFAELKDEVPLGLIGLKSGATLRFVSDTASTKVQFWLFSL